MLLNSCTNGNITSHFSDKYIDRADVCMEQLFGAIKLHSKDAIKELFSQKAIEEVDTIDDDIERFLSFVNGNAVSWNRDESPMIFDSVEYGEKTIQLITWYKLNTDKQRYLVLLVDYPIDTINPENVGLYSIRILKLEDEDKLVGTLEEWVIPSIYILDN